MITENERRELAYRLRDALGVLYSGPDGPQRFVHLANAETILREIEAWGFTLTGSASSRITLVAHAPVTDGKCPTCGTALTGPTKDFCNRCKRPWHVSNPPAVSNG